MGKPMVWDQQEQETSKAFEAFAAYRDMGIERSIAKVAEKLGKSTQTLTKWSVPNNWINRALSYDRHQSGIERSIIQRKKMDTGRMRLKLREGAYQVCRKLIPQILEMLDSPLWEDVVDGRSGQIVRMPAKWSKGTIATLSAALATLAKFALDDGLAEELDFDPLTASPEDCRAWAERVKGKIEASMGIR